MKAQINQKKIIWSLIFNLLIFAMMIVGLIIAFAVEKAGGEFFKYFTTQSNILMGVISGVFSIYLILILKAKIKVMPKALEIAKLLGTTGVVLTFLTVLFFLAPTMNWNPLLFTKSCLFYHVLIPIFSLLTFILFEHSNNKYYYPETFYALIHMVLYSIVYLIIGLAHLGPNGKTTNPELYDWYGFFEFCTVKYSWACIIVMIGFTYLIIWLLWLANKKINLFTTHKIKKNYKRKTKA